MLAYQRMLSFRRSRLVVGSLLLWLGACGDKSIEQRKAEDEARVEAQFGHMDPSRRPMTEAAKIEQLVELVRDSGHTFIRNGEEYSSTEAADHLMMKLEKAGDRVHTAEEFIGEIASRSSITGAPYHLRTADGSKFVTRDWLLRRLGELEARPKHESERPKAPSPRAKAPTAPVPVDIEYALEVVADSGLRFVVVDAEKEPTVYEARNFSRLLRRKWRWIGSDIDVLETWLDEIATRSYKTDLPYQVELEGGRRVQLRPWLDAEIESARASQEGSP